MIDFYLLNKYSDEEIQKNAAEIVTYLRKYTKLTQKAFCELYHIPLGTFRDWENDRKKPSPYLLEFMYARVMLDFENAIPSKNKNDISNVKEFYLLNKTQDNEIRNNAREILRELRIIAKLSQRQFCELYHIQHGVLSQWERNVNRPSQYLLEFMYARVMLDFK